MYCFIKVVCNSKETTQNDEIFIAGSAEDYVLNDTPDKLALNGNNDADVLLKWTWKERDNSLHVYFLIL